MRAALWPCLGTSRIWRLRRRRARPQAPLHLTVTKAAYICPPGSSFGSNCFETPFSFSGHPVSYTIGPFLGYRLQFGNIVVGIEGDASYKKGESSLSQSSSGGRASRATPGSTPLGRVFGGAPMSEAPSDFLHFPVTCVIRRKRLGELLHQRHGT